MSIVAKEKTSKWAEEYALSKKKSGGTLLDELQEKAMDAFSAAGLPDKKVEDYKYTNIKLYLKDDFAVTSEFLSIKKKDIKHLFIKGHATFVMINGICSEELSQVDNLPKEVTAKHIFDALKEGDPIAKKHFNKQVEELITPLGALNTGLISGGLFLSVPAKYSCKVPVHILHISTSDKKILCNPRNLVYLGECASLSLVESYYSVNNSGKTFTNSVTEIVVEKEANLEMVNVQDENENASQHNIHEISVATGGKINSTVVTLNGGMVRNDLNVLLHGEHTEIHLNGLFIPHGNDHFDNHTLVEHFAPNCFSNELYKGILADSSTGVFNGKIYVHQEAQKTNAYQSNKNVILGDKASINTKPQLEIYADDVKCTHGTSTGKLNEEALFYLQARGLNKDLARKVLLQAFANEVIDTIKDEALKTYLEDKMQGHIA